MESANEFWLLVYNSESGDHYHFLFNEIINYAEKFLRTELPWECDEDGLLIGGGYHWEALELEKKEENEGSQEAYASPAGSGVQI